MYGGPGTPPPGHVGLEAIDSIAARGDERSSGGVTVPRLSVRPDFPRSRWTLIVAWSGADCQALQRPTSGPRPAPRSLNSWPLPSTTPAHRRTTPRLSARRRPVPILTLTGATAPGRLASFVPVRSSPASPQTVSSQDLESS